MTTLRTVVLLSLDVPFTILHLSVVIFILSTWRNDMMLRSGFYSLFVLTAIADIVHQLLTVIWQQLPIMFPFFVFLIDKSTNDWSVSSSIVNDTLNFVILLQAVCHTTVAFNRFSCFYAAKLHERLWSGRRLKLVMLAMLSLSFLGIAYFLPAPSQIYPDPTGRDTATISLENCELDNINLVVLASWYIAFAMLNFVFSVATVFAIRMFRARNLARGGSSLTYNADVRLFVHSLFMLFLQLYLTFHYSYFTEFFPSWMYPPGVPNVFSRIARFLIDTYNLSGSPFLLLLSPDVRRKYLAFYLGLEVKSRIASFVQSFSNGVSSVRTIILLCLDIPFTILHVTVVVFLLVGRRHDSMIRSGFYTLFVVNVFADVIHQLASTVWQQLPIMFPALSFLIDKDDSEWSISSSVVNNLLSFVILVQALCNNTIAFNRFSCFYLEGVHEKLWNGRWLAAVIGGILLVSLLGVGYFLPHPSQIYPYQSDTARISYFDSHLDDINLYVTAGRYAVLAVVNFVLSCLTIFAIRGFMADGARGPLASNADVRLFALSLVMLLLQLYLAFHYLYFSNAFPDAVYTALAWFPVSRAARFFIDTYNLSASPFLLILSPEVRKKYFAFYFGFVTKSPAVSLVAWA